MSSKAICTLATGACVAFAGVTPALAHHSTAAFYSDDPVTVEAEIVEWSYKNPHAVLVFKNKDGDFWVGEMGNIFSLNRQGVTPDTLPVGATIEIVGAKSRSGNNRIHVLAIRRDGEAIYGTPA
jgi:hypothetical protein